MLKYQLHGPIAQIQLDNPPVNALSRKWAASFHAILDQLAGNTGWRVLRLGSNQRVFSAGGDMKAFASRLDDPRAGDVLAEEAACYQELFARIEALPQISIAEITGVAAGGGLELALACDLRTAAQSARVGLPEVGLGLLPSAGGTQRLVRLCGKGRAMRLIGGAEMIDAAEARELGLVEFVSSDAIFAAHSDALAQRLAAQPLEALRSAKRCISAYFDPARDGFAEELQAPRYLMGTAETRAKIQDFISKRTR
jgi:enoyl-CoA hydratase/carnithine racemase